MGFKIAGSNEELEREAEAGRKADEAWAAMTPEQQDEAMRRAEQEQAEDSG